MKKSLTLLLMVATITLTSPLYPLSAQRQSRNPRPRASATTKFHKTGAAAPGQYIVMLRKDTARTRVPALASALTRTYGGVVEYLYTDIFKGFSVKGMSEAQARALSRNSSVTSVEESARVQVTGQQYWPEESGVIKPLDRIDQRSGELDAYYNYPRTGTGVHVYIVDTGIWIQHNDFGGRAYALWDFQPSSSIGGYATGSDNHGTLSASAVGSKTWGVAKNVLLYSVRVHRLLPSEQGTASDIAAGLQQVLNDVVNNNKRPAVVNISLETPRTAFGVGALESAVTNLINNGITVVCGAGNDNAPASNFSPGWMPEVINVGASTGVPGELIDARASYSNFGSSVDVYAPGADFGWSVRNAGHNTTYGFDGNCCTSIAAPEVTGVIALYLEQFSLDTGNFFAQPGQVQAAVKNNASFAPLPIVYMGCDFISPPSSNPIDTTRIFVRQQYYDFLSRQPDQSGWDFWTQNIDGCNGDPQCIEVQRINTSRAFFESIEFQNTGYYVFRLNKISFSSFTKTDGSGFTGPNPRMEDFLIDQKKVGNGVVVLQPGWEELLAQNKAAFAEEWVNRPRFQNEYPWSMSNEDFVDKLYMTAGVSDPSTRDAMVDGLNNQTETRGSVVRKIADSSAVADNHPLFRNPAYVLMQYFGYLRRNPDDPPDNSNCPSDPLCGFHFWLDHLNQVEDTFEMVHAFLASGEYRNRFYQPPFCQ